MPAIGSCFSTTYWAFGLLSLFNPVDTSLRGIQQATEWKRVQKKLGCPRVSLGSLAEATQVFGPEPVKQISPTNWPPTSNRWNSSKQQHLDKLKPRAC